MHLVSVKLGTWLHHGSRVTQGGGQVPEYFGMSAISRSLHFRSSSFPFPSIGADCAGVMTAAHLCACA